MFDDPARVACRGPFRAWGPGQPTRERVRARRSMLRRRQLAGRIPAPMCTTSSNGIARSVGFNTGAATLGFELLNREIGEILAAGVS